MLAPRTMALCAGWSARNIAACLLVRRHRLPHRGSPAAPAAVWAVRSHANLGSCGASAAPSVTATAAEVAADGCDGLTSPGSPLPGLFTVVPPARNDKVAASATASSSAPSAANSRVGLYTDYADVTPTPAVKAGADPAASRLPGVRPPAASYVVKDTAAFEQIIAAALHVTPVKMTTETTVSTSASAGGSSPPPGVLLANHTVRELQALLADAERTIAPVVARKAAIDRHAYGVYLPLLKYGTFALLVVQFVVYFNWIFFVFDWNLVEPTTYFLAYTGVFGSLVYHYYRCGEDGFTWKNLFQHLARRRAEKLYAKAKLDVDELAQVQRLTAWIKDELARTSV